MAESKKSSADRRKKKTSSKSSSEKGSNSTKKTGAKTSTASGKGTASNKKRGTSPKRTSKKKTGKRSSQHGKAKIKVRVTKEDVSGIEESMEETKSSSGRKTNKDKSKTSKRVKKDKETPVPDVDHSSPETREERKGSGADFKKREIKGGEPKHAESSSPSKPRSISLYRKMALTFIVLTVLLLGAVCYFFIVNLTITIIPEQERVSDNLIVEVHNNMEEVASIDSQGRIEGAVEQLEVKETGTYQSSGEEVTGKEIDGRVRIINNYSQDQPLVAGTRLLSPNNKLYRIEEKVNVPAGGSVEVDVYTEDPGPEMAIGPTEFTIPGLWAGLQDRIYAESLEEFTYETRKNVFVKESDIDQSISELEQGLTSKVERQFANGYKGYDKAVYELSNDSIDIETDAEAGDEVEEFEATMTAEVNIVAFNDDQIINAAKKRLNSRTSEDKQLVDFEEGMKYAINDFDHDRGVVAVEANFSGNMTLAKEPDVIDKKKILGLSEEQIKDYLDSFEYISDYKIDFTPSFIDKAPFLVDRIDVRIQSR